MNNVTLSGWAQPYDALQAVAPDAMAIDYAAHADSDYPDTYLKDALKDAQVAIGWSLGGALLMRGLSRGGITLQKLVLLAPPAQFVRDDDFLHGMDSTTFDLFYDNYATDPTRTAKRFAGLIAKGDSAERDVISQLGGSDDAVLWHPWLDMLDEQKAYYNFENFPETLIIHGKQDAIVSHKQAEWLNAHIPNATLYTICLLYTSPSPRD